MNLTSNSHVKMATFTFQDENGKLDCSGDTFIAKNFQLESGVVLMYYFKLSHNA